MAATVLVGLLLLISSHYRPVEGYRSFKDRTLRTSSTGGLIHQVGQRRLLQGGGGTCGSFPDSDPFDGVRDGQTPNAHETCYTASGSVMFCCPGGSTLCSCPPTPPPDSGPFTCYNYVNSNDLNYNTDEPCGAFLPGGPSRAEDPTPSPTTSPPSPTTSSPIETTTPSPTEGSTPSPTPTGSDTPPPTGTSPTPTGSDTPPPTGTSPTPTGSDTPSPTPTGSTAPVTEGPTPSPTAPIHTVAYPRGAVPPVQPGPSDGWCGYDGNGQALNLCTSSLQVQFCCPSGYVCPTADPVIAADPLFSQVVYCQPNNQIPGAYY